ncbi:FtsX-like permease family protein [Sediminibacillus halophilus]|uniref:Putative ABC transport system permease protein n=1 Tax=Sediminibacillus halophilus TaxID=482461 RepID=A0A1G9NSI1_9BACI|nr:ABC transporter permease [Sediminibacillus halophilus]SDL89548.1 putative ABC transport system permease protein [Sediminibacillus halophilus]
MIKLALKRIVNRKLVSISIMLAFICLYVCLPLGREYAKESQLTVENTIADEAMGAYDILVRPAKARTDVEQALNMVEENYIGDSKGGISIGEWEEIKADPSIDVAAPVSSIGYFTGAQYSIELPNLPEPTRLSFQFYTTDGLNNYPLDDRKTITYFEETNPGLIQYIKHYKDDQQQVSNALMFMMPPSYYMLAGIDPDSEQALTGIDFSQLTQQEKEEEDTFLLENMQESNPDMRVLPVLQRDKLQVPLYLSLQTETLDIETKEALDQLGLSEQEWLMQANGSPNWQEFTKNLLEEPAVNTKKVDIDLSSFQSPFEGEALRLDNQFKPHKAERYTGDMDTSVYFTASKIDYQGIKDQSLSVRIVKDDKPPAYKEIEQHGVSAYASESGPIPFVVDQVGTFTPDLEKESKLAASPLGIYTDKEIKTAEGKPVQATTVPGSFVPALASGVTTMEAAEYIKGEQPIDAIRLRVAGITSYNQEAQEKINDVATNLLEKGYEVDIVAGSSFKEMEINAEGIGSVFTPWTTLGVAGQLTDSWNFLTLLTTGLFLIFAIVWLAARLTFEAHTMDNENELLRQIGWNRKFILLRNCMEQYILTTLAYILSLLILYSLGTSTVSFLISTGLWLLSLLLILFLMSRKNKGKQRIQGYNSLAGLRYYKRFIIPAMSVIIVAVVLLSIQLAAFGDSIYENQLTSLGAYVTDQAMWFQLAILATTFALAIIGVNECINTLISERHSEFHMYKMIGWTKGHILRHFSKETFTWASTAIIIGVTIGVGFLMISGIAPVWIAFGSSISLLLMIISVLLLIVTRPYTN